MLEAFVINQLNFFSFLCRNNIDVGLISETWLSTDVSFSNSLYRCYRLDRIDGIGGGVAIVVRKTLKHSLLPKIDTKLIENIGVELFFSGGRKLSIFCVYFPGRSTLPNGRCWLKNYFRRFINFPGPYLIRGDLNCRHRSWVCLRANTWGNILTNMHSTHQFRYYFLTPQLTYLLTVDLILPPWTCF